MLAPFIESVFKRVFAGIRDRLDHIEDARKGHVRWVMQPDKQWDCSYALPCRKHLVDGIVELADAIGLAADLPAELRKTLAALFGYRNKMFHLGSEKDCRVRVEVPSPRSVSPRARRHRQLPLVCHYRETSRPLDVVTIVGSPG
jgi:hypothetical protein